MRLFPLGVKFRDVVSVQCPHIADPREQRGPPRSTTRSKASIAARPLRRIVLLLRQRSDVLAGVE